MNMQVDTVALRYLRQTHFFKKMNTLVVFNTDRFTTDLSTGDTYKQKVFHRSVG